MKIFRYLILFLCFVLCQFLNVNALVDGCIESGTSLAGSAKLGSKFVGSNYYYEYSSGTYNESSLNVNFCTEWQMNESVSGVKNINFVVEYCVNGSLPVLNVWSSYSNFVDFTYPTGKAIYLSDGDWSRAQCYQSFLSLNLKYSDIVGSSSLYNYTSFTSNNNTFGMLAYYGYNVILRYTNLIYYNNDDYNNLLLKTKEEYNSQIQIDQNNSIINKQDEAENTRKGIWETIKSLPSTIINLLVDGLKSLFIPTETQISEVIEDSKELSENFGFIGEGVNFSVQLFTSLLNVVQSTGCVDFPEFSLDFTNIDSIGHSVKFWDKKSVCLADNQWFGTDSNGIVVIRSVTTIICIVIFLNFCYRAFFRVLSKRSGD